ncbi:procathepsin L-like [Ambystoma mexicanum]|uniref:procathepsin L-like n=1 Tax=Ambystoma mexicanum TaxID=8296 RepID=UPI0037E8F2BB
MVKNMDLSLITTVLLAASSCALNPSLDVDWKNWRSHHGKHYPEGAEAYRRKIWENNLEMIARHNEEHALGKHSFSLKINHFGDLLEKEFEQLMNGALTEPSQHYKEVPVFERSGSFEAPKEVNWSAKGFVTPVKNQGHCGSCWAFSATGALEGQIFKKTGQLVSLSEQNLVDCSKSLGNRGCSGGYISRAFEYVRSNGGIDPEAIYPYVERDDGTCHYDPLHKVANCSSYSMVQQGNEEALEEAVASVGPVSVAVYASLLTFRFYHSGVYYDPSCTGDVNHAMLAVGYNTSHVNQTDADYWIVKNSWTEHWGEQGYLRLKKGANNHCGVANQACYPNL